MNEQLRNPVWWLKAVCAGLGVLVVGQLFNTEAPINVVLWTFPHPPA